MSESEVYNLEDVDLIITVRSGKTDLKTMSKFIQALSASVTSPQLKIVLAEERITSVTSQEKRLTTIQRTYHF